MQTFEPNAVLVGRCDLAPGLASFFVRPNDGRVVSFERGQFTTLALPRSGAEGAASVVRHAYSFASSPDADAYEFLIREVPGGSLTPQLFALDIGDPLWVEEAAHGNFTLRRAESALVLVFVATGTGIAPFRSMLSDQSLHERFARVVLIYGARSVQDLAYGEEFEARARGDQRFKCVMTVSREPETGAMLADNTVRGRVLDVLCTERYERVVGIELRPENSQVFLCGNPAMIDDAIVRLEVRGFRKHRNRSPGNVHTEKYW